MWADWELAGEAWSHPSLLRWWPVMRRSRVLVLLIPATVLTHSSPAPHTGGSNQPTAFYCFLSAQTWSFIILYISTGLETFTNLWSLGIYCFRRQTETLSHGFRDLWCEFSRDVLSTPKSGIIICYANISKPDTASQFSLNRKISLFARCFEL